MNNDQFDKLFRYIEDFRNETNGRFDAMEDRFGDIEGAIAEQKVDADSKADEQVLRDAQWGRMVDWAGNASRKIGIPAPEL